MKSSRYSSAFTLVELIVVITILAILATIAFMAYEGYSASARDSKKISETSLLYKGLSVAYTKSSKYPEETNMASIMSGTTVTLAKQSKIGKMLGSFLGASSNLFASASNYSDYTYTLNPSGSKAQITSFLEKRDLATATMQSGSITKYIFSKGDSIPLILTSSSYEPAGGNASEQIDITSAANPVVAFVKVSNTGALVTYTNPTDLIANLPVFYTSGNEVSWVIAGGGDCTGVNNRFGFDGDTSTCLDTRIYNHLATSGATHSRIYNLLKIEGKWWFNQNLAYPLATGYKWSGVWPTSDLGNYSCPGVNFSTTVNCNLVSSAGYLYQWSAAMAGWTSNNNQSSRTQGICPPGWGLPTKADVTSISDSYWPDATSTGSAWYGNTTHWLPSYAGCRNCDYTGNFWGYTQAESFWLSFEFASVNGWSWSEYFSSSHPLKSLRGGDDKSIGYSVRCIKN